MSSAARPRDPFVTAFAARFGVLGRLACLLVILSWPFQCVAQDGSASRPQLAIILENLDLLALTTNGTAEVWRVNAPLEAPVRVRLKSDSIVELPTEVIIPAGRSSVTFPLRLSGDWFSYPDLP